jgi:hypothetical protein
MLHTFSQTSHQLKKLSLYKLLALYVPKVNDEEKKLYNFDNWPRAAAVGERLWSEPEQGETNQDVSHVQMTVFLHFYRTRFLFYF